MRKLILPVVMLAAVSSTTFAQECADVFKGRADLFSAVEVMSCDQIISSKGSDIVAENASVCVRKYVSRDLEEIEDRVRVSVNLNDDFSIDNEDMTFFATDTRNGVDIGKGIINDRLELNFKKENVLHLTKKASAFGQKRFNIKFNCEKMKIEL